MGTLILHWGMALDDDTVQILHSHGIHLVQDFSGKTEQDLFNWVVRPTEIRAINENLVKLGHDLPPCPIVHCQECYYSRTICDVPFCLEQEQFLTEKRTSPDGTYCRFFKEAEANGDG